jgi:hypothetical protein
LLRSGRKWAGRPCPFSSKAEKGDLPCCPLVRNALVTAVRPYPSTGRFEAPATVPPNFRNAHIAVRRCVLRDRQALGRLRRSPLLAGRSASEKADVRLCGAIEGNRPTAADPGAHGNRQVSNTNGHPPAGQSRRQGALTLPGRLNGEGHKLTAGSHHSPHRNSPITDFPITRARMSWAQRLKRVFGIDIETMTYRFLRTF